MTRYALDESRFAPTKATEAAEATVDEALAGYNTLNAELSRSILFLLRHGDADPPVYSERRSFLSKLYLFHQLILVHDRPALWRQGEFNDLAAGLNQIAAYCETLAGAAPKAKLCVRESWLRTHKWPETTLVATPQLHRAITEHCGYLALSLRAYLLAEFGDEYAHWQGAG